MFDIVTLEECREMLRLEPDETDHDARLQLAIGAATEATLIEADDFDPDTAEVIPPSLKMAVLARVMEIFDGEKPFPTITAERLIQPFRKMGV